MIYAIVILCLVAGLTIVGTLLSRYPGYVELSLSSGHYEMPLWYFVLILCVLLLVLMLTIKIVWFIIRLPSKNRANRNKKRYAKAQKLLEQGMKCISQGQWKKAEKLMNKGAHLCYQSEHDPSLFLSYAAQAAQQQGANDRRDRYLLASRQLAVEGVDTLTTALNEAELHLEANETAQAIAVLQSQEARYGKNPRLLLLELAAYEQQGDYAKAWELLKQQKKFFANKAAYLARQLQLLRLLLEDEKTSLATIEGAWQDFPKQEKTNTLILSYASALVLRHEADKAEEVLARAIRQSADNTLIHAYAQLDAGSSTARMHKVISWLRQEVDNAYLHYAAARLAFLSKQYVEAATHAQKALSLTQIPEAFALLGKIYEQQGEMEKALFAYKNAVWLLYPEAKEAEGEVLLDFDAKKALPDNHTEQPVNHEKSTVVANDAQTTQETVEATLVESEPKT